MGRREALSIGLTCLFVTTLTTATFGDDNPLRDFFPYGVYVSGTGDPESIDLVCKDLKEHHMNAAWLSGAYESNIRPWLEAGTKHGVRVVVQGGGPPMYLKPDFFSDKDDMVHRAAEFYRPRAERFADEPGLLAWSPSEENPIEPRWFWEGVAELSRMMNEWDPKHPIIMVDNLTLAARHNAQVVRPKALVLDKYVFWVDGFNGPYTAIGRRSVWIRSCQRMRNAAESIDVPYWMMGQGCLLKDVRSRNRLTPGFRYPTPAEVRWQLWSCIQEGAKGFFYFMYANQHELPGPGWRGQYIVGLRGLHGDETPQYLEAAELGMHLKLLGPLLLRLEVAPIEKQVVYWENTPVSGRTHIHRDTGQRFVILVNHDTEKMHPIGIELGHYPGMIPQGEALYDIRFARKLDYFQLKTATLAPGDGTICFVGTDEQWGDFSKKFYADE